MRLVEQILAEQVYENEEGNTKHFYALLDAFKDKRYIRVNGKLLFAIYKPYQDCLMTVFPWRDFILCLQ